MMFENWRGEMSVDDNGYVESDPTGRYGRFDDILGKGAMKTVYRAFDEQLGMEVAWNQAKLCDVLRSAEALQRMHSEVNLLSTLTHESIIRFHASWIDPGKRTFNFITEMFTSGTLREYRGRYRRVDIRAVKNWARQILHGLVYLHSHDPPVIHRDLKCDNIFVNGHLGQVKIGDLGLAAILRESQSAHSVIGTPEFMAPELYEEEYNELVDIYSFGMCMLEMLTAEYPYSECSNPAQIYKKVTSGKLPDAFYCIQDPEARRFIGRCLETVSKRSSARDLLLDPFLVGDGHQHPASLYGVQEPEVHHHRCAEPADMTITGKMNPEDDTIFLKVQIADKEGQAKNIYFPFDIVRDTPIDVANEMVKELEITDRNPSEIAEMIAKAIAILAPDWNNDEPTVHDDHRHAYNYSDEFGHPFYSLASPSSSKSSSFGLPPWRHHGESSTVDWVQDQLARDDDDETSSMHSGKYSNWNYHSGNEREADQTTYNAEAPKEFKNQRSTQKSIRFCPDDDQQSLAARLRSQCSVPAEHSCMASGKKAVDGRRLMRNQSMVDLRSQLLHRTLVEEFNKRLFKTVGAVENIGFQMPCEGNPRRRGLSPQRRGGGHGKQG